MNPVLPRRDAAVAVGGFLVVLAASAAVEFLGIPLGPSIYAVDIIPILLSVAGLYVIYRSVWGGRIGRATTLIGIGLFYYGLVTHPIHLPYHVLGNPNIAGLVPAFWMAFVHASSILAFIVAAYGFYLLRGGQGVGGDGG